MSKFTLANQNILTHSRFRLSQLEPHCRPIELYFDKEEDAIEYMFKMMKNQSPSGKRIWMERKKEEMHEMYKDCRIWTPNIGDVWYSVYDMSTST